MDGILRVTPDQLISTAGEFDTCAGEVSTLTNQMTDMVTALSSIWQGDAAEAYKNKFNGLNDDIQKMIGFIKEHANDLKDIAYSTWVANFGQPTIDALAATRQSEIKYILEYLQEAPLYETLTVNGRDFVLTHSGLGNFSPDKKLSDYTSEELLWNRPGIEQKYFDDITVVFGHTPTVYYGDEHKGKMLFTDTWIDIDVGAGLGLPPAILRLDDMKTFYCEE